MDAEEKQKYFCYMAETKLIKDISSELWSSTSLESFRDRKEPAPLFVFSSHLPLFHFHFLPSAQVAFILLNSIKFLPRDSYEGSFTGCLGMGCELMMLLHFDAKGCGAELQGPAERFRDKSCHCHPVAT